MKKKMICNIANMMAFFLIGKFTFQYYMGKKVLALEERADRNAKIIKIFSLWMKNKQQGKNITSFLEDKGFCKVAIYGMHFLGECLYGELKNTRIVVLYGIDKNAAKMGMDIKIVTPEDKLEKVDAIIVTPVFYYNEIERKLSQKIGCPIISIEDILENL